MGYKMKPCPNISPLQTNNKNNNPTITILAFQGPNSRQNDRSQRKKENRKIVLGLLGKRKALFRLGSVPLREARAVLGYLCVTLCFLLPCPIFPFISSNHRISPAKESFLFLFFLDWKNLAKCHNVLVSQELNITGSQKLPGGQTIRPQSAQSLLCGFDSWGRNNRINVC